MVSIATRGISSSRIQRGKTGHGPRVATRTDKRKGLESQATAFLGRIIKRANGPAAFGRHEANESQKNSSDGPSGIPGLRMVCRDGETDLLVDLPATIFSEEDNVGRFVGIFVGEKDPAVINASFERRV